MYCKLWNVYSIKIFVKGFFMKNAFKLSGIITLIVIIVFLSTACDNGNNNQEFSFYCQVFNEDTKNAVRDRNGVQRNIYNVDANEVDLFELFELNDKWTGIHKDKPTDPIYIHAVYDNPESQDYPWYVDCLEAWGYDGGKHYWRDYQITTTNEVLNEFYTRIINNTYGELDVEGKSYSNFTVNANEQNLMWFTVNKYLDNDIFTVCIGVRYNGFGVCSYHIALEELYQIILEF